MDAAAGALLLALRCGAGAPRRRATRSASASSGATASSSRSPPSTESGGSTTGRCRMPISRCRSRCATCRRTGGDRPGRSSAGRRGSPASRSRFASAAGLGRRALHRGRSASAPTTGRRRPRRRATMQPYPKDGLAVSPPQTVERIAIVSPTSDEARALMPSAARRVQHGRAQGGGSLRPPGDAGAPAKGACRTSRRSTPSATTRGSTTSRRRARTASSGRAPTTCEAMAFGTGWFARDGDQRALARHASSICWRAIARARATCCRWARCGWTASCSGSRSFPDGTTSGTSSSRSSRRPCGRPSTSGEDRVELEVRS